MWIYFVTVIVCSLIFLAFLLYKAHTLRFSPKVTVTIVLLDVLICLAMLLLPCFLIHKMMYLWCLFIVVYLTGISVLLYIYYAREEKTENTHVEEVPEETEEIDELLDRGFAAKSDGIYGAAAEWFMRVLAQKPAPDMAYYLIMDVYNMREALRNEADMLKRLGRHCLEYKDILPVEMKENFSAWLIREKLLSCLDDEEMS